MLPKPLNRQKQPRVRESWIQFGTWFYSTMTRQNMPIIEAKQKVQTEMMNNLDERALAQTQSES